MRKLLATTLVGLSLVTLTACGNEVRGNTPAQVVPVAAENVSGLGHYWEVTITYKGKPLDCVATDGSHGERSLTCDWVKYHQE